MRAMLLLTCDLDRGSVLFLECWESGVLCTFRMVWSFTDFLVLIPFRLSLSYSMHQYITLAFTSILLLFPPLLE